MAIAAVPSVNHLQSSIVISVPNPRLVTWPSIHIAAVLTGIVAV